jgi:membrane fusion protein (multidrug efflux system)
MENTVVATETKPKNKVRPIVIRVVLAVVLLLGLWYGYNTWRFNQSHESTDNAQVETYLVPVLPRVAGYVKAVKVLDYELVKKGQVLIEIDDAELQLALGELEASYQQALADIENARSNIENANLSYKTAVFNSELIKIRRAKAQADLDRDSRLFADNAITRKQLDDTQNNYQLQATQYNVSLNDVLVAKSRINVLETSLHRVQAALKQIQSRIEQQKLRLTYAQVMAPQAGRIGRKSVQPGQFVQAGQTLMTVVNDSTFWVVANFKETQLEKMKVGNEVEIKLDAYPKAHIRGKITSFSEATGAKFALLPPDNASGNFVKVTQRLPVKIDISDQATVKHFLKAGLSAEVVVKVSE